MNYLYIHLFIFTTIWIQQDIFFFLSGALIEGCVENKSLFFVVTVSLRHPKLRAAVMQKMYALDQHVFFIN
jgi:hypothetical protein